MTMCFGRSLSAITLQFVKKSRVGKSQGCCLTSYNVQNNPHPPKPQQKIFWSKMSIVPF